MAKVTFDSTFLCAETLGEAIEQSNPWVPLIRVKCHPDTKMFLCSLFAPVCLANGDRNTHSIYPCRKSEKESNFAAKVTSDGWKQSDSQREMHFGINHPPLYHSHSVHCAHSYAKISYWFIVYESSPIWPFLTIHIFKGDNHWLNILNCNIDTFKVNLYTFND